MARRYGEDFKRQAVELMIHSGKTQRQVSVGTWWVQIGEPQKLVKYQPFGGYLLDNRQVQMTCAKSAEISLGDRIKFRTVP